MTAATDISKTPLQYVIVTLDKCSRTYGNAPCTAAKAAGSECYNTYPTCQDRANFNRTTQDYYFIDSFCKLPFLDGSSNVINVRPYIKDISYQPTEIKDSLTINSRCTITLFDEPDGDVGVDPYAPRYEILVAGTTVSAPPDMSVGSATFISDTADLAPYVGTDAERFYRLRAIDNTGKQAYGYIHESAGGGAVKIADTILGVPTRAWLYIEDGFDKDNVAHYLVESIDIYAPGTFWKKLLARNANYKGRTVKIYNGLLGQNASQFTQKFVGAIDNVKISKGSVAIEVVDLLKSLSKIDIPPKLNLKLAADITAADLSITLDASAADFAKLDSPAGYIRIGDEIIYYTATNSTTKIVSSCTRGYFSTTAATHSASDKVQKVKYYAPANPFDILSDELLPTDCAIAAGYIDSANFDTERDSPGGEVNFSAIISEPTKADKLFFEIVELLNCRAWVGEDLKITIRRALPNKPGRVYSTLTDEANNIDGSLSVDLNQTSRISRVSLYWDRQTVEDEDKPASYNRLDVAIDADGESANGYNEAAEKIIYCRWLRQGYVTEETMNAFAANAASRIVSGNKDPMPILTLDLEMKDGAVKTGDYAKISTGAMQDASGNDLSSAVFQVVRRERKGNKINLKCLMLPTKKYCIVSPASYSAKSYATATAAEREYGAICNANGDMSNGDYGYRAW